MALIDAGPVVILVIDDNEGFARYLSRTLTRAGYEVAVAGTAGEGLARLAEASTAEPFALAIVDYNLPDYNGIELARLARERGDDTKFVLISGARELLDADESDILKNFEQVIGKPILPTAIVEIVNRYTGRNMSLPISKEIAQAAQAAGVEVQPPPPIDDDGGGSV